MWLVKTHPVHVKRWGTFVRLRRPRQCGIALDPAPRWRIDGPNTEQDARDLHHSSIPSVMPSPKTLPRRHRLAAEIEQDYNQKIAVPRRKLWSLEERNLYKLLTEVQVDGETVDRYETPFGIRTVEFDAQQGLLAERQARQAERHLQSSGPRRRGRRGARCSAVLPHSQAAGDGLQLAAHLAQSAHARAA